MSDEEHHGHSPLGASGAERWTNCHGSVALLQQLQLDTSDEEDWTREGTAMHEAGAAALEQDLAAWELVGETFHDTLITAELANPLQIYLDYCRPLMAATKTFGIEYKISSPVHPLFFGQADFWALAPGMVFETNALHVVDLKGGQGIMVDVEENMQTMYYAFGVIDGLERQRNYHFDDDMEVVLTIVQPRGWMDPVRRWSTSIGYIKGWVHNILVPHMLATAYDNTLTAGEWCRFCPAKLICPMLTALFKAACLASPEHPADMTDAQLGLNYPLTDGVLFFVKALKKEAQRRLEAGRVMPELKLVYQKTNRTWKDGAEALAAEKFGDDAFTVPAVKSPAQLEKVAAAKDWVKEFSFQPKGGLTVALASDPKPGIDVARLSERYEGVDIPAE